MTHNKAREQYEDVPARVKRVIDGDTLEVELDLGFHARRVTQVRLRDVDTAEIHGVAHDSEEYARGQKHTSFVRQWVEQGRLMDLDFPFVVDSYEEGKYHDRWIGTIMRMRDGHLLSDDLIDAFPEVENR